MTIERFENNNLYCQITILNPLMNVANVMFFPLLKKKSRALGLLSKVSNTCHCCQTFLGLSVVPLCSLLKQHYVTDCLY